MDSSKDYEEISHKHCSINNEDLENSKLFLFQVPKDFDVEELNGIQINIKDKEGQVFEQENENLVVQKQDKETLKYMKQQILPLFPMKNNKNLIHRKSFNGTFKVYKQFNFPGISKKIVKKTKPLSLKNKESKDEE